MFLMIILLFPLSLKLMLNGELALKMELLAL